MESLAHQEGELRERKVDDKISEWSGLYLVSVLADSWHPHSPGPVVVEVSQLVRQHLQLLWIKTCNISVSKTDQEVTSLLTGGVLDDVVVGGVHRALPHRLRHEEEVVPGGKC